MGLGFFQQLNYNLSLHFTPGIAEVMGSNPVGTT